MTTEENSCLVCFEENNDTILKCCNKGVHGSCIKQWWVQTILILKMRLVLIVDKE